MTFVLQPIFFIFLKIFYLFLEEEGGRERGTETSVGSLSNVPLPGTEPATQASALTGIEPVTFWFAGQGPTY